MCCHDKATVAPPKGWRRGRKPAKPCCIGRRRTCQGCWENEMSNVKLRPQQPPLRPQQPPLDPLVLDDELHLPQGHAETGTQTTLRRLHVRQTARSVLRGELKAAGRSARRPRHPRQGQAGRKESGQRIERPKHLSLWRPQFVFIRVHSWFPMFEPRINTNGHKS